MDMEFMDLYRRTYAASNMQSFNGESHGQPQHAPFWNQAQLLGLYDHNHHKHHQAGVGMMGHPAVHGAKQTDPKPRLAKDEVDLLESEFTKNQKPNSNTKRELAEKMGVEISRINNWFQNRRAKEKQVRKAREFEAQQAKDRPDTEDEKSGSSAGSQDAADDEYELDSDAPPVAISSAVFKNDTKGAKDAGSNEKHDDDDDDEIHGLSELEPAAAAAAAAATSPTTSPEESETERFALMDFSLSRPKEHHDMDTAGLTRSFGVTALDANQTWCDFADQGAYQFMRHDRLHDLADGFQAASPPSLEALGHGGMFDTFPSGEYLSVPQIATFPSSMLSDGTPTVVDLGSHGDAETKPEKLSPASKPASSPTPTDLRFKCPPPPTDIAGRRNMRRPAPLGISALRGASHCHGIKTGMDAPRRSDVPSPMRRIASATGVSGRIQKPLLSAGPRSPFAVERNREALLQSIQHHSSTLSPGPNTLTSALSPLFAESMGLQGPRETPVSTTASDDDGYTFGSLGAAPFLKVEHALKSPPGTPGVAVSFLDSTFSSSVDHAWNFMPPDEPLPTPSLCSHGSELEFSVGPQMPGYVASHSQPVTPSFPPPGFGPTYNTSTDSNLFAPTVDYTFPDSYPADLVVRSSPRQPKQFQFAQNVTPQNFTGDR